MARHLSVESAIDKNKLSSANAWLALLEVRIVDPVSRNTAETIRIARNDENVVHLGVTYTAANFDFNITQNQNQAPQVTLSAEDQTRILQSRMEQYSGGVFSEVVLRIVNSARLTKPAEHEQIFQILGASVKDYVVSFDLGAENPLALTFPRHRQFQDRCAWRFKGYGCGYVGAQTKCDYSLDGPEGCSKKGNQLNFRGLPGLVRLNM